MLSRSFDMGNITSKVESIKSTSSSLMNNTLLTKGTPAGYSKLVSDLPFSSEVANKMGMFCASKKINKNSTDWLSKLNRMLNGSSQLNLCKDAKANLSEGDTVMMLMSKLRGGGKIDTASLASSFAGQELSNMGFKGSIPGCLLDKLTSLLGGVFGIPGNLIPKIDLSKLLNNKCVKDTINSTASSLDGIMKGGMVASMLGSGNKQMANQYAANLYKNDPKQTKSILENNISSKNNNNTSDQLGMLSVFNSKSGTNGNIDKSNVLSNLDKETTNDRNNMHVFDNLNGYYGENDTSYFKGKSNLNSLAVQQTANKKSNDNIASSVKTTNLDSSSLSRISNLWG
jgi:hypothetical protein